VSPYDLASPNGATVPAPLAFRLTYPAHGRAHVTAAVLATEVRSTALFRVDVSVRSTAGNRYTLRYVGNGGVDRRAGRTLTLAMGRFDADGYTPLAIDVTSDLARIDPTAVVDSIIRVRLRGALTMHRIRACA